MNSRERRLLHLALAPSGLISASKGEHASRYVVLYPEGTEPAAKAVPLPDDRRSRLRSPDGLAETESGRLRSLHRPSGRPSGG